MNVNRTGSVIGVVLLITGLFAFFNNCGKIEFQKAIDGELSLSESGIENLGSSPITDEEADDMLSNLPDDEISNPRPISDLEEDPSLYDIYRCSDSDGVVICHFPSNVEAQATQCVGRPAISSHFSHIRAYNLGDGNREISDYLGPCRVEL